MAVRFGTGDDRCVETKCGFRRHAQGYFLRYVAILQHRLDFIHIYPPQAQQRLGDVAHDISHIVVIPLLDLSTRNESPTTTGLVKV